MDNRAGEMQVFLRVVDMGSFAAAASAMRMTPSTVSKLVARVESRLGVRLLERSTRRLSLTAEGKAYAERSRALLDQIEEMERDLAHGSTSPGGTVRITASVGFGTFGVQPLLPAFWDAFPNITIDLSLSDEIVDLYLDRTDVAFRVGRLPDSGMTAVRLGTAPRRIVASPAYLEAFGVPVEVEDLTHHRCLGLNFRRSTPVWPLRSGGQMVDREVSGPLIANNGETLRHLALAGAGLARMGEFHVREDIRAGRLIAVMNDVTEGDGEDVHALYLGAERMPHRVRAFLNHMVPNLRGFIAG